MSIHTDKNPDENEHWNRGVGDETRTYCSIRDETFGPHPDAKNWFRNCPYCGGLATDGSHRVHEDYREVSCDKTTQSTWRYCPGCGERVEG